MEVKYWGDVSPHPTGICSPGESCNPNPILGSEMIGNFSIKTKRFDFEERVLIGWVANTVREPANQDAYLKVHHLCIDVKVVYHF